MSSLLSLPDEILLAIISYFSLDGYLIDIARPTLYALSLVSKRLYRLATHCLYRFILIHRTHDNGASRKYNLILRSVKNNAELGTKVHTLVLVCDYSLRGRNPQELLTCLPNLRKLDLEAGAYDDRFDHRFYLPPPATACHYVLDLKISKPSKQDLPYLLIQCRIHDLKLDITGLSNLRFITPTPSDQARKASLQSLVLSPSSRISINAFQNLMSYPAFLLHLKIPLPGVVRERSNCFLQQAKFSYPLSPKAISHALSPTFKTLESLDLEGGTLFPGHDGSTFSMTSFQKLKAATIPAELFFSKRSQSTSLDQLLPRSLMSLEVSSAPALPFFNPIPDLSPLSDVGFYALQWLCT